VWFRASPGAAHTEAGALAHIVVEVDIEAQADMEVDIDIEAAADTVAEAVVVAEVDTGADTDIEAADIVVAPDIVAADIVVAPDIVAAADIVAEVVAVAQAHLKIGAEDHRSAEGVCFDLGDPALQVSPFWLRGEIIIESANAGRHYTDQRCG
jgi:hypothetical protein